MSLLREWWNGRVRFDPLWRTELPDHIVALAWSPDDRHVAAAVVSGPVATLDADTGAPRRALPGHGFGTSAVAWVDGGTVATAGQDGRVRLWDAAAGAERLALAAGASWVERLAVSPCGSYVAAAAGKKVRLWGHEGELVQDYTGHASTVTDLAWGPNGSELTSSAYGGVFVWSPGRPGPVRTFEGTGSVLKFAWAPEGKYLATGQQDATVHVWVSATGQRLQMSGYPTKVRELAWDRTGRFLATGGGERVTVWDCSGRGPEGTKPLVLAARDDAAKVRALAFQRQGSLLASGGDNGLVTLWRPEQGTRPVAETKLDSGVSQLVWSGDDGRLVVGTEAGEVLLFGV